MDESTRVLRNWNDFKEEEVPLAQHLTSILKGTETAAICAIQSTTMELSYTYPRSPPTSTKEPQESAATTTQRKASTTYTQNFLEAPQYASQIQKLWQEMEQIYRETEIQLIWAI